MRQLKKSDFSVGQTIYLRIIPHSNPWRRIKEEDLKNPENQIIETTVLKVGNKYITTGPDYCPLKFDIKDDFKQASYYGTEYEIYLSAEDIVKEIKREEMFAEIREAFDFSYKKSKFSYEQINAVYNILFPETEI